MAKKFTAIRENIIVRVFGGEEKTAGGIIIRTQTEGHDMKREEGEVVEIGPQAFWETEGTNVKIGDRVAFAKYAGKLLESFSNGDQIRVMKDIDLLCKIEETEEEVK